MTNGHPDRDWNMDVCFDIFCFVPFRYIRFIKLHSLPVFVYISFCFVPFRFASVNFVTFHFASFRFVSRLQNFVTFHFVLFRFGIFRFAFHFAFNRYPEKESLEASNEIQKRQRVTPLKTSTPPHPFGNSTMNIVAGGACASTPAPTTSSWKMFAAEVSDVHMSGGLEHEISDK